MRLRQKAVLLFVGLALSLAGCGSDTSESGSEHPSGHNTSESSDPTDEPSGEPTETAAAPEPEPTGEVIEVSIKKGKISPALDNVKVKLNEQVTIIVTSDAADEVHVHGYEKVFPIGPGKPGKISFKANVPGVFEVETHDGGDLLFELQAS